MSSAKCMLFYVYSVCEFSQQIKIFKNMFQLKLCQTKLNKAVK